MLGIRFLSTPLRFQGFARRAGLRFKLVHIRPPDRSKEKIFDCQFSPSRDVRHGGNLTLNPFICDLSRDAVSIARNLVVYR
jgi:hypothetical protein